MSAEQRPDAGPNPLGDDERLAALARDGDRRALEVLLHRHADLVHAVCRRIVLDPDDALDATQEALVSIARSIGRFDGRARFTTWCYRIATNAALDEVRRARRRPVPVESPPGRLAAPDPVSAVDDRVALDAALAELPPDFRAAVVLRDLCDLDYAEIARVLGIPPGTVRSRIARGRAALAVALGEPAPPGNRQRGKP